MATACCQYASGSVKGDDPATLILPMAARFLRNRDELQPDQTSWLI
ncbi:MAG: hypothetical protein RLY20_2834 [Verrucomicrobiota bacterium]